MRVRVQRQRLTHRQTKTDYGDRGGCRDAISLASVSCERTNKGREADIVPNQRASKKLCSLVRCRPAKEQPARSRPLLTQTKRVRCSVDADGMTTFALGFFRTSFSVLNSVKNPPPTTPRHTYAALGSGSFDAIGGRSSRRRRRKSRSGQCTCVTPTTKTTRG